MFSKKNFLYGAFSLLTLYILTEFGIALYSKYEFNQGKKKEEFVEEHPERSIGDVEVTTKEYVTSEQLVDESCGSMMSVQHEIKTSAGWYEDDNVVITNPTGWLDVENPEEYWNSEKIKEEDYLLRRNLSTYMGSDEKKKGSPFDVTL